ncbi:MAG: DUF1311 domain-containing protein [Silvanigrellales bacterium]|jgi:uncharacterized protein YecT (DUF1311 family)|nr:DUF1311 domain-containing protein [Silvanigrellales bacterium]
MTKLTVSFATLVALSALSSASALAQSGNCGSFLSTNEVFQCLVDEHSAADKALNVSYSAIQDVLRSYSTTRSKALVAAQRAWISLRDLDCASEGLAFEGGSLQKIIVQGCLTRKTKERTTELETQYELQVH